MFDNVHFCQQVELHNMSFKFSSSEPQMGANAFEMSAHVR